jgi:phosphomannomutase
MKISSFKAYDVRGRLPDELNEEIAYLIGRGYAEFVKPKRVVVGRDIRLSSPQLRDAVSRGLTDSGVDVYDIGPVARKASTSRRFTRRWTAGSW